MEQRSRQLRSICAGSVLLAGLLALAPAALAQGQPFARENRLAFNLGVGFGSASLSGPHDLADLGISTGEGPKSGLQLNAELAFRYYFPFHLLGQLGCGALYNWASEAYSTGPYSMTVENHNLVLEVPILVGGYWTFIDRIYAYAAVGPAVYFYSRSWFDPNVDFKGGSGAGFQALLGADFLVAEHFALGLELRYRYLNAGDLMYLKPTQTDQGIFPAGTVVKEGQLIAGGSDKTYPLDFSGISLALNLRFFAL